MAALSRSPDTLPPALDRLWTYKTHDRVARFLWGGLNTTIKAVLRRARGMRDETMLLLKLKWATARPIRSSRDLATFLDFQLHSNR